MTDKEKITAEIVKLLENAPETALRMVLQVLLAWR